jgi:beta-mannosidase
VQRPVKGLWLDGGDGVQWSDNLLDLLPDEEVTITATGLGAAEIQVRWLGQEW